MEDRDNAAGAATKYSAASGAFRGEEVDTMPERSITYVRPLK